MDINNILIKYFGGDASKEEVNQLEQWKEESMANLDQMQQMKKLWENSDDMLDWEQFDANQAWDKLTSKIQKEEIGEEAIEDKATTSNQQSSKSDIKIFSIGNITKIAAIGLLLLMTKFAYDWSQNMNIGGDTEITHILHYEAQKNNKNITLPDGSAIVLSPNSVLDIKENFMQHRNIKLVGNAYFKVARDESSPFIVHTSKGKIKVLGTQFSILNHDDTFELFVTEGKVAYTHKDRTITLTADDMVSLINGNIIKTKMYNNNYLSWKTNKLVFRNAQWMNVFKDLNRHFHIDIDYTNIKQSDCKLNTIIQSENIDTVLKELEILWNLKYEKNDKNIKILSIKC